MADVALSGPVEIYQQENNPDYFEEKTCSRQILSYCFIGQFQPLLK
ncbi:hypothetical protein Pan161_06810 [Gimesia algae]|uniref:Uncharacterized protein n=1 Tax=Gimesia algae TaxID=2527971 RepID=A0A517V7S5_9PLAN|nr:hypothetical protein Pan161_06810 [Gimesia algae]